MRRAAFLVLVLALPAWADDGPQGRVVVVLQDGRKVEGELKQKTKEAVVVEVAGVSTRFPRDWVEAVNPLKPLARTYRKRLAELDPETERYNQAVKTLAKKAIERQDVAALDLAASHLQSVSTKGAPELARLKRIVRAVLGQAKRAAEAAKRGSEGKGTVEEGDARRRPWLTARQIRLVKVYESRLSPALSVKVDRETVDTLLTEYRQHPEMRPYIGRGGAEKLRSLPDWKKVALLFDLRARELYARVRIQGDPESVEHFRTRIHPSYALRYCGRCHHGGKAAGLDLVRRFPRSRRTSYTNYVILRRTRVEEQPLVDPQAPSQSPFLQFGLPRESAVRPHPEVPGWRPFFRNKDDRLFSRMAKWIGGLYNEQDRYPVSETPSSGAKPTDAAGERRQAEGASDRPDERSGQPGTSTGGGT